MSFHNFSKPCHLFFVRLNMVMIHKKMIFQIIYRRYSICTSCTNSSCRSYTSLSCTSCPSLSCTSCTSNTFRSSLFWISDGKDKIWLWIWYNWLNMIMGWSIWDKKEKISGWGIRKFLILYYGGRTMNGEEMGEEEGDWVGFRVWIWVGYWVG